MVLFQEGEVPGRRKKIASMNDKCAGGTGVVIEKIAAKLHLTQEELLRESYQDAPIYPVAGKCGVFAETDITGLQKQGVPASHLMASLYQAIVLQNLTVLTRGHTLLPKVYLLGGPNAYYPGLQAAWRKGLLEYWKRKEVPLPANVPMEDLVLAPPKAEYFAAMGAIAFGVADTSNAVQFLGTHALELYLRKNASLQKRATAEGSLHMDAAQLEEFRRTYFLPPTPADVTHGDKVEVYI
jgi:activator of 2-hydroxyglutaryl-CoA dehydratase